MWLQSVTYQSQRTVAVKITHEDRSILSNISVWPTLSPGTYASVPIRTCFQPGRYV
jgi:hypothetical protein